MLIKRLIRLSVGAVALYAAMFFSYASSLHALSCDEVRQLTGVYFRLHFSEHTFDDELSKKVLNMFQRYWDPGKLYFLQSDIDKMDADYGDKLDNLIAKSDCSAIKNIMGIYSKRYEERKADIKKAIDAPHDFTITEYLSIDRKNETYAKNVEEIYERWRKRIKFQELQLKSSLSDMKLVKDKLHKRYQLEYKRSSELTPDDLYASFLNAFSLALDPHSEYMAPDKLEDFRINTRLSLEGIGAVLRSDDGFTKIQSLVPGGAADKTGKVQPEDKIIAVSQGDGTPVDVIDMDLKEVVKLIRGPRGTTVKLTMVRDDKDGPKKFEVNVIREKVELKDRGAKSFVYNIQNQSKGGKALPLKIGVIDLPSFYIDFEGRQAQVSGYKSSSEDVKAELVKLKKQKIDALILDLRSNGGGSLDEAIKLAGLFFDAGPVVQVRNMDNSTQVHRDEDGKTYYDGPLTVLINRHSASASEIFAGAIKDYKRGLLIGDSHTFGKGTVQSLTDLSEKLGAVKVTISKFYRPLGASTQVNGVDADVVLPSLLDEFEVGEKSYDYAMPFDKIKATEFKATDFVSAHIEKVKKQSDIRINQDTKFKEIFAEIKKYKENELERNRVSLKEEKNKKDDAKSMNTKAADNEDDDKPSKNKGKKLSPEEEQSELVKNDVYLQESLKITTDYWRSLNNQNQPVEQIVIKELEKVLIAEAKNNKTDKVGADKKGGKKLEKTIPDASHTKSEAKQ